jgi:membrane-bound lytic murein transglycosylase B
LSIYKYNGAFSIVFVIALFGLSGSLSADYSKHPKAISLMDKMVLEHNYDRTQLERILTTASREDRILKSMKNSAEKVKPWSKYRPLFVTETRVKSGAQFLIKYRTVLKRAEQKYGVPPEVITAIIGVETNYGGYTGKANVLNSLSTLAFEHPRRSRFFTSELENYLLLVRERNWQADKPLGSYAGAMGLGQFMPSNYRRLAVDFNNDGVADLFDPVDAIGSVANYFKHHGWVKGQPVAALAVVKGEFDKTIANNNFKPSRTIAELEKLGYQSTVNYDPSAKATVVRFNGVDGDEYWIGLKNFYVISRYNPTRKYAMAVYHVSQEINRILEKG